MKEMKKPEKGKKPERIRTKAPPGGNMTPGAKAQRKRNQSTDDKQ